MSAGCMSVARLVHFLLRINNPGTATGDRKWFIWLFVRNQCLALDVVVLRTVNSSCAGANEQIVKEEMGACNESENESYYEKTWGSVYWKNRKIQ